MSRPESSELQSLNNSTRNATSSKDTSPTSPITTPSPPFAQPKEHDSDIPAAPAKVQKPDGSSVTINPPTFKRGMVRKQHNPVMMQRLEQFQKKKQNVAQTEAAEEPDFVFSTKTGEQYNISPKKYAKRILDENEKYFKQAHRIGAEPNTTTTPKPKPEPEPEPKKKKRYKGPGKATTNMLDLT